MYRKRLFDYYQFAVNLDQCSVFSYLKTRPPPQLWLHNSHTGLFPGVPGTRPFPKTIQTRKFCSKSKNIAGSVYRNAVTTDQCRRRVCRNAASPSISRRMATVSTAQMNQPQNVRMKRSLPTPCSDIGSCMKKCHAISDNSVTAQRTYYHAYWSPVADRGLFNGRGVEGKGHSPQPTRGLGSVVSSPSAEPRLQRKFNSFQASLQNTSDEMKIRYCHEK